MYHGDAVFLQSKETHARIIGPIKYDRCRECQQNNVEDNEMDLTASTAVTPIGKWSTRVNNQRWKL